MPTHDVPTTRLDTDTRRVHPVRTVARLVGAVFLLVGVLGFVPGITQDVGGMTFAGHESDGMLLGIFQVSILHNVVHFLFGVAGLAMSRSNVAARGYLVVGGAIYLLLWLYGLLVEETSTANLVPVNDADDVLHLGLGVLMLGLGLLLPPPRPRVTDRTR